MRRTVALFRILTTAVVLTLALGATGCAVTLYQPLKGLQRPVVLASSPRNFEGLRVLVRCNVHEDYMPRGDATKLCRFLATSLDEQGAETEWVVPQGKNFVEPVVFEGERADLTLEIESRIEHEYDYPISQVFYILSWTMIPSYREQTFTQRVTVYGRDKSVLAEDFFRERFVQYDGCGVWSLNWIIDWVARDEHNKVSGDVGKKDFARDFYGQTRQLLFNASVRSDLLGLHTRRVAAPAEPPADGEPAGGTTGGGAMPDAPGEPPAAGAGTPEAAPALPDPADLPGLSGEAAPADPAEAAGDVVIDPADG